MSKIFSFSIDLKNLIEGVDLILLFRLPNGSSSNQWTELKHSDLKRGMDRMSSVACLVQWRCMSVDEVLCQIGRGKIVNTFIHQYCLLMMTSVL